MTIKRIIDFLRIQHLLADSSHPTPLHSRDLEKPSIASPKTAILLS
jgi:hypothetical protein